MSCPACWSLNSFLVLVSAVGKRAFSTRSIARWVGSTGAPASSATSATSRSRLPKCGADRLPGDGQVREQAAAVLVGAAHGQRHDAIGGGSQRHPLAHLVEVGAVLGERVEGAQRAQRGVGALLEVEAVDRAEGGGIDAGDPGVPLPSGALALAEADLRDGLDARHRGHRRRRGGGDGVEALGVLEHELAVELVVHRVVEPLLEPGGEHRDEGDERHADHQRRGRGGGAARGCAWCSRGPAGR